LACNEDERMKIRNSLLFVAVLWANAAVAAGVDPLAAAIDS
jgi:fatty acid desaturase